MLRGIAHELIEYRGGVLEYCIYARCKAQSSGKMYVCYLGKPKWIDTNIKMREMVLMVKHK